MTPPPANQRPNDGPFGQPMSRLDELLADRAVQGLSEGEEIELRRLLTAAGKAEDSSLDLAAAACNSALYPADADIAMPASLLAALDREGEAWCNGVHSHDGVSGRIPARRGLTEVGQGRLIRTPFKRFTREYGGWLAAAACLCFGVYAWNTRGSAPANPTAPILETAGFGPTEPPRFLARPFELAAARIDRWFNESKQPSIKIIPLGAATPEAGPDVAVGEVAWNTEEGSGLLQLKSLEDVKSTVSRTYRVSVRCPKTGKQVNIETPAVTLHPGQKEVVVPLSPSEMVHGAAAFVVSVCSQGPMGVPQSEDVIGIGGSLGETSGQVEPDGG